MSYISLSDATLRIGKGATGAVSEARLNANNGLIGESDAIEFPQEVEILMKKVGVRGEREWGRTGEHGGEVKVKTMATSGLGRWLRVYFESLRAGQGIGDYLSFVYIDENNGQKWECTVGAMPKGPLGPKAGSNGYEPSIWTIEFQDIKYVDEGVSDAAIPLPRAAA